LLSYSTQGKLSAPLRIRAVPGTQPSAGEERAKSRAPQSGAFKRLNVVAETEEGGIFLEEIVVDC
jgi:hypothetical protein